MKREQAREHIARSIKKEKGQATIIHLPRCVVTVQRYTFIFDRENFKKNLRGDGLNPKIAHTGEGVSPILAALPAFHTWNKV